MKLEGEVDIKVDYRKFELDAQWDGLKGYWTNTTLPMSHVIAQYGNLWKIERAFRISKTDLKIRPIYHRLKDRIEAHICIAFVAYKIYRELERKLKLKGLDWSAEKTIEISKTIFEVTLESPLSGTEVSRLHLENEEQHEFVHYFGEA